MANNFPALPSGVNVASLAYSMTFQQKPGSSGPALSGSFINAVLYNFGFTSGLNDDGGVTPDYTGFDQDTVEASLITYLDAFCAFISSVSGVDASDVANNFVTITRLWGVEADAGIGSTYTPSVVATVFQDTMTYPMS